MGRQRNLFSVPRGTLRPQNLCKSCGYSWYPRGKSLSPKCPHCGSSDTSIDSSGCVGGGILVVVVVLLGVVFSRMQGNAPQPHVLEREQDAKESRNDVSVVPGSSDSQRKSSTEVNADKSLFDSENRRKEEARTEEAKKAIQLREEAEAKRIQKEQETKELEQKEKLRKETEQRDRAVREADEKKAANRKIEEEKAGELLKWAKRWLNPDDLNDKDNAVRRLEEILRRFPNTESAKEARKILDSVAKKKT